MSFVLASCGKIVRASLSACTLFQYEAADLEQTCNFRDLFPPSYKVGPLCVTPLLNIDKALWDHDKKLLLSSVVEVQVESIYDAFRSNFHFSLQFFFL